LPLSKLLSKLLDFAAVCRTVPWTVNGAGLATAAMLAAAFGLGLLGPERSTCGRGGGWRLFRAVSLLLLATARGSSGWATRIGSLVEWS